MMKWMLAQTPTEPSFWMPPQASTYASDVDWVFYLVYWITIFFVILNTLWMIVFVVRYRRRKGHREQPSPSHSTALELTWTIVPTAIVVMIFYYGFRGALDMSTPPPNTYEINVSAYKWGWTFTHPNGASDSQLHVPIDRPVRLIMTSNDVIHSLFIPAFRAKRDVVPGRYHEIWFEAQQTGTYDLYCAEYCGTNHSKMITKVVVHEPEAFAAWLEEAANWVDRMSPMEAGKELLENRLSCKQCHTIDGSRLQGPSFKNLFGSTRQFTNGQSRVADENYIRDSILYPGREVVQGFENAMPTFQGQLRDNEITALIEYIKTLSDNHQPPAGGNDAGAGGES